MAEFKKKIIEYKTNSLIFLHFFLKRFSF